MTLQGISKGIEFSQGPWNREVKIGDATEEFYGLVEAIDNNPLVCADRLSVPGPAATFALIALYPLIQAGLVADSPVVILSFEDDGFEVELAIERAGWSGGVSVHSEPVDVHGILAATVMVSINTPEDLDEIDFLYNEQFGRSFYVRRDEESEWNESLVKGQPFAIYRVRISLDSPQSLLTVRVLSDLNGKAGALQAIHAMNIMCGFEESLGIN